MKHYDYKGEEITEPPGERPKAPPMPQVKNPLSDKLKDNEIKMQMAKDILCSLIKSQRQHIGEDYVEQCLKMSEKIFNHFNV